MFDASIDWLGIEKAYLYGDPIGMVSADSSFPEARHYPSLRELGERFGVHFSLIGRRSRSLGWKTRRESYRKALEEETDRAVAKAAALSTADAIGVIDTWVGRFEESLRAKRVRADSVSDLNTIMRLREFLLGNADSRTESNTTLTLDGMQKRFATSKAERLVAPDVLAGEQLAGVINEEAPANPLAAALPAAPVVIDEAGIADSTQNPQSGDEDPQ